MKTKYEVTIGLEIHAELKTQTKMFCGCKNDPLEKTPNVNICPICLAHPGTLPTPNKKAIELVMAVGYALGGKILEKSHFDRKSYFYPDLPKGYQISQYEEPFIKGGELVGVEITRVHLEEDTARLIHDKDDSYLDFNRAGLPLMELVTEPVIHSADKALEFAKEFQLILRYLGASDANMERGQMRVEPNISIALEGSKELGTKVELKNINSFKVVKNAIAYEIKRQKEVLDNGKKVVQETRGWDEKKGETFSQRIKEESDDYRYMPEPDLPPIQIVDGRASPAFVGGPPVELSNADSSINMESIKLSVPELPQEKRERFVKEFGLREDQVEVLVGDRHVAEYFEEADSELSTKEKVTDKSRQLLVNYLTSDVVGLLKGAGQKVKDLKISPENFAELIALIEKGEISSRVAKDVLREMFKTGADPSNIIKEKDLGQISDEGEVADVVKGVIKENEKATADYKKGKETAIKFLVGQAMAKLRGRGDPSRLEELFKQNLK